MKSVLFDLDGTLLDTEASILGAFEYVFEKHGVVTAPRERIQARMGSSLRDMYREFLPDADLESLVAAHRDFQADNMHLVTAFPHALETIERLKQNGFDVAIVTSRLKGSALEYLQHTRLLGLFSAIVTGDDVVRHKPHPEGIFQALQQLGSNPNHAYFVGDTHADIGAGRAANVVTIGALYGHSGPEHMRTYAPDHLIDSLRDVAPIVLA